MLTLCWILAWFVSGAEVREIHWLGCSQVEPLWYRAVSEEKFVLQCALPKRAATHRHSNSVLQQPQVRWFWQQKDEEPLKALQQSSTPALQGDALWFKPVRESDSGVYICVLWEKILCLKMVLEVETKAAARCLSFTDKLYLLAGTGNSITCPGTTCYSHVQKSSVKWYKDGQQISPMRSRQSLRLRADEIYLLTTYEHDAGLYVCDYILYASSANWTLRTAVAVQVIAKNTLHPPNFLYPSGMVVLEAELGKPLELECRVQFGFERVPQARVTWKRSSQENGNENLDQETRVSPQGLKGHTLLQVAKLQQVTEKDLRSNFTCFAENLVGNATAVVQLRRKQRVSLVPVLSSAISSLAALLLCTAFIYQHWIEIVLMYRSYLLPRETAADGKEFDAFVSYAKLDSPGSDSTLISEEKFALELLPDVLENKYGYKLCILERDVLPGGAYTDEVVTALRQSRRALIILSPAYLSGPSLFELQAAVSCALEDKKIKVVLIKFQAFHEPQALPPVVKKALRILPVLTWKSAATPDKKFWRYLCYHMPVKATKVLGNCSLKSFVQRLFSL
ncbi:I18RA protein, partial [Bucco capensis]|nr:I18RA protein [Bucco capensis]